MDEFNELGKLYCKFDELDKLRMSSMSWISLTLTYPTHRTYIPT